MNYIQHMKNLHYLRMITSCVVFLVATQSCNEDQLEINNPNQISQDGFFQAESNYRLAVNGMFHPITAVLCWGRVIHTGPFLRSDAYNIVPFQENTTMSTFQTTPGISRWSQDLYAQFFLAVSRANDIINSIDTDGNTLDENIRDEIAGQAYFVRAFAYWYLVNFWGSVPLVIENPINSEDFFPSRSTPEAVNQRIIDDLTIALDRLPKSWGDADLGRPTSGAALALRGKTYLYTKDYKNAILDFQKIVDEFDYQLLPAVSYSENFTTTNENNEESIFELQFLGQDTFVWGSDIPLTGTQGSYLIDYAPPSFSLDQGHFINPHILKVFEDNADTTRRNETLVFDYPGATGYGGLPFTEDYQKDIELAQTITDNDGNQGVPAIFSKKYAALEQGTREDIPGFGNTVGNNWRLIRYADVLLMLAEALNEDGRTAEAIPFINQVRIRALITPLDLTLDQAQVEQAIIDERIMELTGEGHRFLDLVRWGIADEILGPNSTIAGGRHPKSLSGGSFSSNRDELLWIPVPELQANPNLLPQNIGY